LRFTLEELPTDPVPFSTIAVFGYLRSLPAGLTAKELAFVAAAVDPRLDTLAFGLAILPLSLVDVSVAVISTLAVDELVFEPAALEDSLVCEGLHSFPGSLAVVPLTVVL